MAPKQLANKKMQPFRLPGVSSPQPARGFTLIELLVTMAILASLVAILVPTISSARRAAKIAGTKNLLAQLEAAIDRFNESWGYYPPDKIPSSFAKAKKFSADQVWAGFPGTSESSEALYYCLANPYATPSSPFIELQAGKECDDANGNGIPEIIDSWGRSFTYKRKLIDAGTTMPSVFPGVADLGTADWRISNNLPSRNKNSYDLWSRGPYAGDPKMEERYWITNWK